MKQLIRLFCLSCAFFFFSQSVQATVVTLYNGFSPADEFNRAGFMGVGEGRYNGEPIDIDQGFAFRIPGSEQVRLTDVTLGLRRYFDYGIDGLHVSVNSHDPDRPPFHPNGNPGGPDFDDVLFSEIVPLSGGYSVISVAPDTLLDPGFWYWILLSIPETSPGSMVGWHSGWIDMPEQEYSPYLWGELFTGSVVPGGEQWSMH
jgi:hypothetical protein